MLRRWFESFYLHHYRTEHVNAVELVRRFVRLIDEISQVHYVVEGNRRLLHKLRRECNASETESGNDVLSVTKGGPGTMIEKFQWALDAVEENNDRYPQYIKELKSSLEVVSHLMASEGNVWHVNLLTAALARSSKLRPSSRMNWL